ncbi:MAG: hypothetical protein FWD65_04755 [Coriobacteriia bacterium]|nr:hypothetical protein [Coriobacteriia bacterium]
MQLWVFDTPPSAASLAIVIALFAVFLAIMAVVVWVTVNLIVEHYPESPDPEFATKKELAEVVSKRRRLVAYWIIADGAFLTAILFLVVFIANLLASR